MFCEAGRTFMKIEFVALLIMGAALACGAQEADSDNRIVIGQPTVFWHNGEWQTYRDGIWEPYHDPARSAAAEAEAEPEPMPEAAGAAENGVPYSPYVIVGGGPWGGRYHGFHHRPRRNGRPPARPVQPIGPANTAIGPANHHISPVGHAIGPTPIGIGQTPVGVRPPRAGSNPPSLSSGQTTIGGGRPGQFSNPRAH